MSGTEWRLAYEAQAREWWTDARLSELTGGKQLLVLPDRAPCLLRSMGILDAQARLHPTRMRKFRQINHMLSFLVPALEQLLSPEMQIIDAGCGRSALGFLVAWWLQERGVTVQMLGLDRNAEVIAGCRRRAEGLPMAFAVADLEHVDVAELWERRFGNPLALDALLALHACDTATDSALALAARTGARFFAVAPCCQAELARKWSRSPAGPLAPMQENPHLRRTLAATVTDAMRVELMRTAGYDVRAVEFVEAHHTPKNTLIYGHRGERGSRERYERLRAATGGCGIALDKGLRELD